MILLQLSSAQGPEECSLAVAKALARLISEAQLLDVNLNCVEQIDGRHAGTFRSVLVALDGQQAEALAQRWCGSVQWICTSPYRPGHGRKNWFIGVSRFEEPDLTLNNEIRFETMRSSGPGGQHVNKTDSAIRATHLATGIVVKVQSERSQHANRRLAISLISYKLQELQQDASAAQRLQRRMVHHQLERGNPVRTFRGIRFEPA